MKIFQGVGGSKIWPGEELIRPKLVRPEAYLAVASSKLCEFILHSLIISREVLILTLSILPFMQGCIS